MYESMLSYPNSLFDHLERMRRIEHSHRVHAHVEAAALHAGELAIEDRRAVRAEREAAGQQQQSRAGRKP